jgi:hypothetical protein
LAGTGEVRSFGHALTQQSVGVLVAAALPGGVRIAEPDVNFQPPHQFGVAGGVVAGTPAGRLDT